jgi:hypothetical protein
MPEGIIYELVDERDRIVYVGQTTCGIVAAFHRHKVKFENGYGIREIDRVPIDVLNEAENYWMARRMIEGYTLMNKVAAGWHRAHTTPHTEEAKAKMRVVKLGKTPWNKGLTRDDPRVNAYVRKQEGRPKSEETRKKISESLIGSTRGPQTDEHRAAISASRKGKPSNHKTDCQCLFCTDPGHGARVRWGR